MPTLESIDQRLSRIEKLIRNSQPKKQTWVKVSIITALTNWSKEDMRKARENGLVKFKVEDGSFKYLLESIPDNFLIKK